MSHNISHDRPIESPSEDKLGRSDFAKNMARAIAGWRKRQSLVIALYGPWGCGKSSLKNMILSSLPPEAEGGPRVLEFNPWQCSTTQQLTEAFFREINAVLSRRDAHEEEGKAQERAARLKAYSSYLGIAATTLRVASALLPPLAFFAEGADKIKEVTREGSEAEAAHAEAPKTLQEAKQELEQALREMGQPLLVVLDDVDRLSADEIALLFQLVKANGDFTNFIYLILCQRSSVEQGLEKLAPGAGRQFLEKIVQIPINIPAVPRATVDRVLRDELTAALGGGELGWENIFHRDLSAYFENLPYRA